jgi:acetyl esterase/lipase
VLQLASLILHPHPSLPLPPTARLSGADASATPESEQPLFGGLLLISPWVEFDTNAPSCVRNAARDVAPMRLYQLFADAVKPGVSPVLRFHFEPGLAPHGWWSGLGRISSRVLVTGGEHEGFIDPILNTAAVISEEVQDTTVFVLPGGVHEDLIEAFSSGEGGRGADYNAVVLWVSKTLKL